MPSYFFHKNVFFYYDDPHLQLNVMELLDFPTKYFLLLNLCLFLEDEFI